MGLIVCVCPLQTKVTGTVTSGRLQERPLCPPGVPRRLTESIRTNSTEADSPPLNGSPRLVPVYHGSSL